VLRVITLIDSANLKALPVDGEKWYEIDDVQDLDIASCLFSEKEVKYKEYHRRYGGYWRFPQVMDYCYLVNPFFPPKRLRDEMRANFDILLESYPSGMYVNSLLAGKYFGVNQEYIVVGNGAAELIKLVMEQHAEDRVGMIFPTFDEYPNRLRPEQIVPYVVETPDFTYSADDLMDFYADKNIKLLLLINPDNPSGNFIPVDDVLRLAEWCEQGGIRLLLDESFVDFTYGFENNSLLRNDVMEHCPNMMVMKSISKSYGVPGLRLGVLASANKDMIALMKKEVSIWNINSMAEFYMQIYGKYEADYKKACRLFIKERERFFEDLQTVPYLRVVPSQANYFLCEVTDKYTSAELAQKCIENDVVISNCGLKRNMANKQLIRLAVRSRKDNERLIEILKSFA
jgi:histidinol-phosphate/aromatic aminotransferase/cobyric acid decarboxylase-like protein